MSVPDDPVYQRFAKHIEERVDRRREQHARNNRISTAAARGDWDELERILDETIEQLTAGDGSGPGNEDSVGDHDDAGDDRSQ